MQSGEQIAECDTLGVKPEQINITLNFPGIREKVASLPNETCDDRETTCGVVHWAPRHIGILAHNLTDPLKYILEQPFLITGRPFRVLGVVYLIGRSAVHPG